MSVVLFSLGVAFTDPYPSSVLWTGTFESPSVATFETLEQISIDYSTTRRPTKFNNLTIQLRWQSVQFAQRSHTTVKITP